MKKEIKVETEYSITIPLWYGNGWGGKVGPIELCLSDLNSLNLSQKTIELLISLQKPTNDRWKIIETKLDGNWSMYTEDQFENARIELGIPVFPTSEEMNRARKETIKKLQEELPADTYKVIGE